MTALRKPDDRITAEEYLAAEALSATKHEYVGGYVYAMAGASDVHNEISLNLAIAFRGQLRGKPCRTFMADVRLKVTALQGENYYYPDVMVACDPADADPYCRERPTVLVEVLSPSTTRADFDKFFIYQHIPTLALYLLVAQDRCEVTAYQRAGVAGSVGEWQRTVLTDLDAHIDVPVLGCRITLAQIYEGTPIATAA